MIKKLAVMAILGAAAVFPGSASAGTCSTPVYTALKPAAVIVAPCGTTYVPPVVLHRHVVHRKVVRVTHTRTVVHRRHVRVVRRVIRPAYDTYSEALRWYPRYTEYVIGCPDPAPWWGPMYPRRACCACGQRPVIVASAPCKVPG